MQSSGFFCDMQHLKNALSRLSRVAFDILVLALIFLTHFHSALAFSAPFICNLTNWFCCLINFTFKFNFYLLEDFMY